MRPRRNESRAECLVLVLKPSTDAGRLHPGMMVRISPMGDGSVLRGGRYAICANMPLADRESLHALPVRAAGIKAVWSDLWCSRPPPNDDLSSCESCWRIRPVRRGTHGHFSVHDGFGLVNFIVALSCRSWGRSRLLLVIDESRYV